MGLKNGKSQIADRQTWVRDGKKDSQGSNTEGGDTPDEIRQKVKCSFTPPYTNLPTSLKTGTCTVCHKKLIACC